MAKARIMFRASVKDQNYNLAGYVFKTLIVDVPIEDGRGCFDPDANGVIDVVGVEWLKEDEQQRDTQWFVGEHAPNQQEGGRE